MKVVIFAKLPIAGAPWLQYQCLKRYTGLDVRLVQKFYKYSDKREFPRDLLLQEPQAWQALKDADVVHIHNYLPSELLRYINKHRQKIVATFHSVPRMGNWAELMRYAHQSYCIRQPMQMREYTNLPSLPNLFDVWSYTMKPFPVPPVNIVYCPTNRLPAIKPGSKAYGLVMPILKQLKDKYKDTINIIHHSGVNYYENIQLKAPGHITIDDLVGQTFHLTSLEGCARGQVVMNNIGSPYPFMETTPQTLMANIERLFNDNELFTDYMAKSRLWMETNWDPKQQVAEYIHAYGG